MSFIEKLFKGLPCYYPQLFIQFLLGHQFGSFVHSIFVLKRLINWSPVFQNVTSQKEVGHSRDLADNVSSHSIDELCYQFSVGSHFEVSCDDKFQLIERFLGVIYQVQFYLIWLFFLLGCFLGRLILLLHHSKELSFAHHVFV